MTPCDVTCLLRTHVHTRPRPARTHNALESFSLRELPILHLLLRHPSEAGVRSAGGNRGPVGVTQSGTQSKVRAEMELSLRVLFLSANPRRVTGVCSKQAEQGILKPDRCWWGGGRNTEVEGPIVMGSITVHLLRAKHFVWVVLIHPDNPGS